MVVLRAKVFFCFFFFPHDFIQGSNKSGICGLVFLVSKRMPVVCTKMIIATATSEFTKMLTALQERGC